MTSSNFLSRLNSRTRLYGATPLERDQRIALSVDPEYGRTFAGQVAFLTAANLIGRMTPSVSIDVPSGIQIHASLPWADSSLEEFVLERLFAAIPEEEGGRFDSRAPVSDDFVLCVGPNGVAGAPIVHGSGWNSFLGTGTSPISRVDSSNPFGAAFAAILAGTHLMVSGLETPPSRYLCNVFDWSDRPAPSNAPQPDPKRHLGSIWTIGTGSVGTAILYFLTLFTRNFNAVLIDKDHVEIENLDRSPIFVADDDKKSKVTATKDYICNAGGRCVQVENCSLSQSKFWQNRQEGTPDLVIAAANEDHVRYLIEASMPPVQVYGTTGKNWQASVIRHIPGIDPCSLCLFPDEVSSPTKCATGKVKRPTDGKQIDAALPFLSFSAGLMAAAEILKLDLPGFPFNPVRTQFAPKSDAKLLSLPLRHRSGCLCQVSRSRVLHTRMIAGSKHAALSHSSKVSSDSRRRSRNHSQGNCSPWGARRG